MIINKVATAGGAATVRKTMTASEKIVRIMANWS